MSQHAEPNSYQTEHETETGFMGVYGDISGFWRPDIRRFLHLHFTFPEFSRDLPCLASWLEALGLGLVVKGPRFKIKLGKLDLGTSGECSSLSSC